GNGWAENVHADDFDRCLETYVASFDARQPFRMEYRLRRHDGAYRWILDEGIPLFDESSDFVGYIGCCLDITEQKRVSEDLESSLERERQIARTLQAAFLPPYLPKVEGIDFQAVYRPATRDAQLGGDWYDAFVLRDGRIALSVGDVFGHGLEAAGAMVRLRETLRAVTGFIDDNPAAILTLADRAIQSTHPEVIASAVFAIYDPLTRRLLTANAGHPPPAIVRNGKSWLLPAGGTVLGVSADSRISLHESRLEAGDAIVLYTDGLTEVDRDAISGERRLLDQLAGAPLEAAALVSALTYENPQDDVAVLALTVLSPRAEPSWRFQSDDANSAHHAREAFIAHLRQRRVDADALQVAAIVFGELVANVVRHAPGPIEVELFWEREDDVVLYVRDRGPQFATGSLELPHDVMSEGGRGLFLMRTYASAPVITKRFGGGNEVCVRLSLATALPSFSTVPQESRGTAAF
ncbi:MAG: SpoIIE family protein phosphatase, partial [Candidatus Eremiobacteraeota bacterium]|nr:SpoIIE family protein phosphatase [Candidatus Eremiobacteraeota bacterium]